jgi:hypothetical protein
MIDWALLQGQDGHDRFEVASPSGIESVTDVVVRPTGVSDSTLTVDLFGGVSTESLDLGIRIDKNFKKLYLELEGVKSYLYRGGNEIRMNTKIFVRF